MSDIDVRKVSTIFGGAVVVGVVAVLISATFLRLERHEPAATETPRSAEQVTLVHQTAILTARHGWLQRDAAQAALSRYGWADRDAGYAEIPIETAMDDIAREFQDGGR